MRRRWAWAWFIGAVLASTGCSASLTFSGNVGQRPRIRELAEAEIAQAIDALRLFRCDLGAAAKVLAVQRGSDEAWRLMAAALPRVPECRGERPPGEWGE